MDRKTTTPKEVWVKLFANPPTRMDLGGVYKTAYDFIVAAFRKEGHEVKELDDQVIIVFFDPKRLKEKR